MTEHINRPLLLSGFGVQLKPVTHDKLEKIRSWRNHEDISANMLEQSYITAEQQQAWFKELPTKAHQLYLLISYKNEDIGVISACSVFTSKAPLPLTKAEVISPGLYLAPDSKYRNSILAFSPSLVFIDYLFQQGCCNFLSAQVFNHNIAAIRYNETLGYQPAEVNEDGLLTMTLTPDYFSKAKNKLSKILRF